MKKARSTKLYEQEEKLDIPITKDKYDINIKEPGYAGLKTKN